MRAVATGRVEIRLGRDAIQPEPDRSRPGIWKTDDPELSSRLRRSFEGLPGRLVDLDLDVDADPVCR